MSSEKSQEELREMIKNMNIETIDDVTYTKFVFVDNMAEQMERMKTLELRHDDVITAGFPRSGNHWTFEVVKMAMSQTTEHQKEEFGLSLLEHRNAESFHEDLDKQESPRQLVTHFRPRRFPTQCLEKQVKVVYILRNPKDVFISFYKLFTTWPEIFKKFLFPGSFDDFLRLQLSGEFPYGSWFDHVLSMEQFMKDHPEIPVHIHCFEHMKENPIESVKKLCDFLGVSDKLVEDIVEKTSLESMKELKKFQASKPSENFGLLRKGKTGGWKKEFNVAQSEMVDRAFQEKMAGSKLGEIVRPYIN